MNAFRKLFYCTLLAGLPAASLPAQGTAFNYQGRLDQMNGPASGVFDFIGTLWTNGTGQAQAGMAVTNSGVNVSNGLFNMSFDFGTNVFNGDPRWLELSARTNGAAAFTLLNPRQQIGAAPYAVRARTAAMVPDQTITAAKLSPGAGASGQVLKMSGGVLAWAADVDTTGVTSVGSGTGLTGGPITTSGTLAIDTAVVPRLGAANTFTTGQTIQSGAAGTKGLVVRGAIAQTANLQEWQTAAGTALASISSNGILMGSGAGLTGLNGSNIAGATITSAALATGSVTSNQLAAGSVLTSALADEAVTADKLFNTSNRSSASLISPRGGPGAAFGWSVAPFGTDGFIVGAYLESVAPPYSGAAYVFTSGGNLLLSLTNASAGSDNFGIAVAAAGDRIAVGAPDHDSFPYSDVGAVHLFESSGAALGIVTLPFGLQDTDSGFGGAVAGVGNSHIIVGASRHEGTASLQGQAYLLNTAGALITTFTNPAPSSNDRFGLAVASLDSGRVLISAPFEDAGAPDAGVVYLFATNGTRLLMLTNPAPASQDNLGISIASLTSDRILVGAHQDNGFVGAAYLFNTNGMLLATFTNPIPVSGDQFGYSVAAIGNDRVLVGARQKDANGTNNAGMAFLFSTNGMLIETLTAPAPESNGTFGHAVAGAGNRLIVGAPGSKLGGTGAGAIYIFDNETTSPGVVADAVRSRSIVTSSIQDGAVTAVKISGVLLASQIPGLDASKIISGTFDSNRIPALLASKITGGVFADARIPSLDAAKIATGILATNRIPDLPASRITSGTLADAHLSANVALRGGGNAFTGPQSMTSGSVGIGTASPEQQLQVEDSSAPGLTYPVKISNETPATPGTAAGILFQTDDGPNRGKGALVYERTDTWNRGRFHFLQEPSANSSVASLNNAVMTIANNGNVGVGTNAPTALFQVRSATCNGTTWANASDRNLKENFKPVNAQDVLAKVAALSISEWNFKDDTAARHIGPVAQDFYAAFHLGSADTHIGTVDADGVALAAIKGLNENTQRLEKRLRAKELEIAELKQRLEQLEKLVRSGARN